MLAFVQSFSFRTYSDYLVKVRNNEIKFTCSNNLFVLREFRATCVSFFHLTCSSFFKKMQRNPVFLQRWRQNEWMDG